MDDATLSTFRYKPTQMFVILFPSQISLALLAKDAHNQRRTESEQKKARQKSRTTEEEWEARETPRAKSHYAYEMLQ